MIAPTLRAAAGKGGNYGPEIPMTIANALDRMAVGPDDNSAQANHLVPSTGFHMIQDPISTEERTPALGEGSRGMGVHRSNGVRRLTPRECERLQGFPDDWTLILGLKCPDSRRYAAMGNAVTTNVAEWIGRRIIAIHQATPETFLEAAALAVSG